MPRTSLPSHNIHYESHENIENKKLSKEVPGPRRARFGSTLTAIDPNTRGSKSSVSSVEETFHTALKEHEAKRSTKYNRSKVFRNSTYSSKDKENLPKVEFNDTDSASPKLKEHQENILEPTRFPQISSAVTKYVAESESVLKQPDKLPEGVINICIDEGLYEYSREVFTYLRDVERALPEDYLDSGSITSNMRMILVDWLIQVQHHLKLTQESLYLCVNILDSVLLERDVEPDKLQLVGITALLMATKLEEYYPAEVGKLLHLTENSYSRKDVLMMERVVLQVLKFQCYIPTAQVFLLRYTRAALRSNDHDKKFYETCCFIIDSQLVLPTHPCFTASETAAAATLLSLLLYHLAANQGQEVPEVEQIWTKSLHYFSGFEIGEILEPASMMVNQMIAACNEDYKYRGAVKKYQSQSQHQKLAYEDHVQEKNLIMARSVLKLWYK